MLKIELILRNVYKNDVNNNCAINNAIMPNLIMPKKFMPNGTSARENFCQKALLPEICPPKLVLGTSSDSGR